MLPVPRTVGFVVLFDPIVKMLRSEILCLDCVRPTEIAVSTLHCVLIERKGLVHASYLLQRK